MSDREAFLRRFHAARPGITSSALARGDSYDRLVAAVPANVRVLDLGCGDDHLVRRFANAVGVDLAPARTARDGATVDVDLAPARTACDTVRVDLAPARAARDGATVDVDLAPARAARDGAIVDVDLAPARTGRDGAAIGSDISARAREPSRLVQARAQALPFADGSFGAAVCHLAFMLFDELDAVVAELRRVVRPGGTFAAILGGGPTADGDDAFHRFLALARPRGPSLGDRRARSPEGWHALFGRAADFTRFELDLSGPLDEVWRFLGASYQLDATDADRVRAALCADFAGLTDRVPCRVVLWLATVTL